MTYEDLPLRWKYEIRKYLNRKRSVKDKHRFEAADFQHEYIMRFEDGSKLHFLFCLIMKVNNEIGIFTQHCGYHIFAAESILHLKYDVIHKI